MRIVLAAAALAAPAWSARADSFADARLAEGTAAMQQRQWHEAVERLRIACFGLLDEPQRLAEGLARLAVAEDAAGSPERARAAASRLVDVERRFGVFSGVKLEPETSAALRRVLLGVPRAEIESAPAVAGFVQLPRTATTKAAPAASSPPPRVGPPPVAEAVPTAPPAPVRVAAATTVPGARATAAAPAAPEPPAPNPAREWLEKARAAARAGDQKTTIRMADRALEIDGSLEEARALRAHARALRVQCRGALADIAKLSKETRASQPSLAADELVCLVDKERWDDAAAVAASLSPEAASRVDVWRALRILSRERPAGSPASPLSADQRKEEIR